MTLSEAVRIGAALKADFVLFGTISSSGQSISIDAKMAPLSGTAEPVSFLAQTKGLDEVMPQIDLFAQQINQKVFGKPQEKAQTASAEAEALATRNPEFLLRRSPDVVLDERDTVPIQAEKEPVKSEDSKSQVRYRGNPRDM
jgi:hypothetical protein